MRPMTGSRLGSFVLVCALAVPLFAGCAALRDDMQRAEQSYDAARYEDALIWFRDLEPDAPSMDARMRTRYFYLRGMTEYRLGHRLQALHYLAVAREIAGEDDVGLRPEWRQIMDRTLAELTPRTMTHRPPEAAAETADQAATAGGEADEAPEAPPQVDAEG